MGQIFQLTKVPFFGAVGSFWTKMEGKWHWLSRELRSALIICPVLKFLLAQQSFLHISSECNSFNLNILLQKRN